MTDNAKNDARIAGGASPVPADYTTLTPFLVVAGAARAIDFYCDVFGAAVVSRTDGPDGSVPHAELDFGAGRLQLGDPAPAHGLVAPEPSTVVSHSTMIYCAGIDDVFQRAVKAGATVIAEPATFVTGDRFGVMIDPFGHRWAIMTRVKDVSPEEAERRVQQWLADQPSQQASDTAHAAGHAAR
jgi:PhnB protein